MIALTIKKNTVINLTGILFSFAYGLLVVASAQRLYLLEDGDISRYVNFFQTYDLTTSYDRFSVRGDGVFRTAINLLKEFFNTEAITVLTSIGFLTSSIIFSIYSINIRSSKYLISISPLFLMVFLTPMVITLFSDQLRSTIAFTILMVAMIYTKGVVRYSLFGLASLMHMAMVPIISLYFFFHIVNRIRIRSDFIIPLVALLLVSSLIPIAAYTLQFNVTNASQGIYYNFLIFCITLLIIFTYKKAINNIYGFISIALLLIYFSGQIIDISYIRYVGYAIVLYLFFLIDRGEVGSVKVFTVGYAPFFLLTIFYKFANYGWQF